MHSGSGKIFLSLLSAFYLSGISAAATDEELGCIRGDCVSGEGTLVSETDRGLAIYRGEFVEGFYHGYGRLEYPDEGEIYKGNWAFGMKNGRGILWDADNNVYIGDWRNDRRNGHGTQAFQVEAWEEDLHSASWLQENTENYTGEFRNDTFEGEGTYRWSDGTSYTGGWAASKKHGRGYWDFGNGIRSYRNYEFDVQVDR